MEKFDINEYNREKVDSDIGYMAGAKAAFKYIQPFVAKPLYDKLYNEFFQMYATAAYKAIAQTNCIE